MSRPSHVSSPPTGKTFAYGTAGFRTDGSLLRSTVYRCGGLAAARSFASGGKATGLVITVRSPDPFIVHRVMDARGYPESALAQLQTSRPPTGARPLITPRLTTASSSSTATAGCSRRAIPRATGVLLCRTEREGTPRPHCTLHCRAQRQMEFEKVAELLANASTPGELRAAADSLVHGQPAATAVVFVARDTRPTGGALALDVEASLCPGLAGRTTRPDAAPTCAAGAQAPSWPKPPSPEPRRSAPRCTTWVRPTLPLLAQTSRPAICAYVTPRGAPAHAQQR